MTDVKTRGAKIRDVFVLAGTVLAVFVPIWFAAAALGTKFGLWDYTTGLLKMAGGIGVPLIGITVLIAFVTSFLVVLVKPRAGFGALAAMWLVGLGSVGIIVKALATASVLPPIHDISTNVAAPLVPSAKLLADRATTPKANPILQPSVASIPFNPKKLDDWSGRTLAEVQPEAYPEIKPLEVVGQTPAALYAKALATAKQQGLRIVTEDAATLRIEGVAESFWFGFKDDVIIAISPAGTGSKVDMRSISRVGISDLGANAKRIERYMTALKG
jgi:uncharacterized protein (DUF1499 family)